MLTVEARPASNLQGMVVILLKNKYFVIWLAFKSSQTTEIYLTHRKKGQASLGGHLANIFSSCFQWANKYSVQKKDTKINQ